MNTRRRFKHTTSLQERLAMFAKAARERAAKLPPGAEKELMLERVRQADAAVDINRQLGTEDSMKPAGPI